MEKEFLEWFEPNEKKFNHGHFDEKEVAYSAWLEGKKRSSQTQDAGKKLIPEGWYVYEAGQNPLNMLWFVVIMNFNDLSKKVEKPRYFVSEECNSFEKALRECVKNIR